ncbi:BREX-1 system adenine-specific DNA-methyltransferase PglX [Paenibacillus sp. 1A_MP2]|uniref:BREX-1 system adenine-specific DNA-methyltransferase PglX n=1 Tax=Paenibacillus sp. 1A_MP2 TaxID=3457495 RepID=UPI003FCE9D3D
MNKTALKNFATNARKELIEKVKAKSFKIGITEENIKKAQIESSDVIYIDDKQLSATEKKQREKLISRIKEIGYKQVIEEVAHNWFNRLIALRFMEVNNYLPTKVRVLSSSNADSTEPDIIKEALTVDLDIDKELVYELKLSNKTEELFKYLVIKQCNSLNKALPFMFETIDDYKEILFPEGLLMKESFLREMTDTTLISESDWEQVEIIGWLYQFYISDKKDQVFSDLKKSIKISKENIPAATQLFTPQWIVKYMVENTLGRLWFESYPESALKSELKYFIEEAEQEDEVKRKLEEMRYKGVNPEDITFLDPCCGSGHILVYAFDIFYEMYLEKGYTNHEIPKLILDKNLFGLDIDNRAAQLASFAVMMKAREKSRRVFGQDIKLNIFAIQESNWITDEVISFIEDGLDMQDEKTITLRRVLEHLSESFMDAKEFGSIINVQSLDYSLLEKRIEDLEKEPLDLIKMVIRQELLDKFPNLILQAKVLAGKYDVVCTNPPYMGNNGMTTKLTNYLKKNYPDTKSDMSTVFMEKAILLCKDTGIFSMINIPVWMYLSSYEKLRDSIIKNNTIINMLHFGRGIFGSDFGTTAFVISNVNLKNYKATYRRLYRDKGTVDNIEQKEKWFFEKQGHFSIEKESFMQIPSSPITYWLSEKIKGLYKYELIDKKFEIKEGVGTRNDDIFLKYFWEVPFNNIDRQKRWIFTDKAGSYRKWYMGFSYVMDWENDGERIKNYRNPDGSLKSRPQNLQFLFKEGVTWGKVGLGKPSFRWRPSGFGFNDAAPTIFGEDSYLLLAQLNSKLSEIMLKIQGDTVNITSGVLKNLPNLINSNINKDSLRGLIESCINISKIDWDAYETSSEFRIHPLLNNRKYKKIEDALIDWGDSIERRFEELRENEEKINSIFIESYQLKDECSSHIDEADIALSRINPKRDVESFISYFVGCIFGRYSLEEEGLVFAGGRFQPEKYQIFAADKDNVLPILSGSYFQEDIVSKFIEFVEITFGNEKLSENIEYIANLLEKKDGETAKETLRRYFINEFFKDHLQTYKKKPIYWFFTSGKQKAFNCLIYMHRYDRSTLSRIRTDYLHELQIRMDAEKKTLLDIINGDGTTKEIANAKKDLKSLDLKIDELRAYDEKLHHMADMQIEIDLDDGVAVNYAKFEGLVAPIK